MPAAIVSTSPMLKLIPIALFDALRAADEWADAEQLHEHEIVHECGAEGDEQELTHR